MRLIRTGTYPLILEEFFDEKIPPYAILSHTWGEGEVSLLDMKNGEATLKVGYAKIKYASDQAAEDKYDYVWVDTCCIDKTSSAELSVAINSMYKWYQKAEICYAFLTDVHTNDTISDEALSQPRSVLSKSRWFTRGWTLQELIAPSNVLFFNSAWITFGTKHSLSRVLSNITGVDSSVLDGTRTLSEVSVAQRMSWASRRQTTRQEDIAYSLIGLFDVNMPMLYGEGKKSFKRLLEEIMKNSDDQSIFAWERASVPAAGTGRMAGLLAESPADYANSRNFFNIRDWGDNTPHSRTSKGLRVRLLLQISPNYNIAKAALKCLTKQHGYERVCIWLRRIEGTQWVRVRPNILHFASIDCRHLPPESHFKSCTIFVRDDPVQIGNDDIFNGGLTFQVDFSKTPSMSFAPEYINVYPELRWKRLSGRIIRYELTASLMSHGQAGLLAYSPPGYPMLFVMVGTTISEKPWCLLKENTGNQMMNDLYLSNAPENDGWTSSIECGEFTMTTRIPESERARTIHTNYASTSLSSDEGQIAPDPVLYRIVLEFTSNLPKKESTTTRIANSLLKILPSLSLNKS